MSAVKVQLDSDWLFMMLDADQRELSRFTSDPANA